jgi:hypothetical protein
MYDNLGAGQTWCVKSPEAYMEKDILSEEKDTV